MNRSRTWWVVLASAIGLCLGYVPIMGFTFSVFFRPISREFGWSRSQTSLGFSLSLLALSIVLPFTGRLVDRTGARGVIIPASFLFGATLAAFYFLSGHLWHFFGLYVLLGIVGSGTTSVPYFKVISQWFDERRGLALGVATAGTGMGTFFMPLWTQTLIAVAGWRVTYAVIGAMVVAITVPVVGFLLKERRETHDSHTASASGDSHNEGMTNREAWRSSAFWIMSTAFFLVSLSLNSFLVHLVPMITDKGISPTKAALGASLVGAGTLLGRVVTGYLLDRLPAAYLGTFFFAVASLGMLVLWQRDIVALVLVAACLIGLGIGAEGDLMAYLAGRAFGLRSFGEIYGSILTLYTLGAIIGPFLMGWVFDAKHSYDAIIGPFVVATAFAATLMVRLGKTVPAYFPSF